MGQTWLDLLFAHWPVAPDALRPLVPRGLSLDVHDGRAYIGVTPFEVVGLRARGLPAAPHLSRFAELNVRTYVTHGDRPGILFLSLDAARLPAVHAARTLYRLPYHHADMAIERTPAGIVYRSARRRSPSDRAFVARYGPAGAPYEAEQGSLEAFLVERYRLYTQVAGRLVYVDIHHRPWTLRPATAEIAHNTMSPVPLPDEAPLTHLAARQDVVVWPPLPVG